MEPQTAIIPEWTFADRLRKARKSTHLTQAEMAHVLDVAPGTYGAWEAETAKPRDIVTIAQRIERSLGIPASWVLGLDGQVRTGRFSTPMIDLRERHYTAA